MKVSGKKEAPAFVLWGSSYNGVGEDVEVSFADLRTAEIGKMWVGSDSNNCGRAVHRESAEVVYKTDDGVAVLHRKWGTTDSPDPESWENAPKLVWYEFA